MIVLAFVSAETHTTCLESVCACFVLSRRWYWAHCAGELYVVARVKDASPVDSPDARNY